MTWSDDAARRSHAFDDWKAIDSDIRTYLELSEKWSAAAYANTLEDAKREFSQRFDPDNDDPEEYFYDFLNRMGGLWEVDYLWMLRAGALRDAVTAFEVYAEKSAEEVLRRWRATDAHGTARRLTPFVEKHRISPSWRTLCRIHKALGNDLETDNVQYIRDLRHLLAHQRGELRTEELRRQFVTETGPRRGGPFDSRDIPLAHSRVLQMMDDLALVVRTCDAAVWTNTRGVEPPTALIALVGEKRGALTLGEK
jgi:hypothetical protein